MRLKIAAVDDEKEAREALARMTEAWGTERGHACETASFPTAEAFLFAYDGDESFDLLFLDVEMPGMDGLGLAKALRERKCRAEMVFVTSHAEFASEGYEVDALHYLVKPVKREKLFAVLDKAAERLAAPKRSILVSLDGETRRIPEEEILYAEARLHTVELVTEKGRFELREPFQSFAARLSDDFFQTHRSYIVSLRHVETIAKSGATLSDGASVPVAKSRYEDFLRAFIERN
ncbi:MAG: response regulator transcription factor [Clostridia bacterium]|nr:response regulator transcription factor [Clostridia bacterium]